MFQSHSGSIKTVLNSCCVCFLFGTIVKMIVLLVMLVWIMIVVASVLLSRVLFVMVIRVLIVIILVLVLVGFMSLAVTLIVII